MCRYGEGKGRGNEVGIGEGNGEVGIGRGKRKRKGRGGEKKEERNSQGNQALLLASNDGMERAGEGREPTLQ
jgi:hypothetical protein